MQARKFAHFLKALNSLTRRQRERLLDLLLPAVQLDRAVEVIEQPSLRVVGLRCSAGCDGRRPRRTPALAATGVRG